jgi:uncharacterized protein YceH (UPF0502 family)
MSTDIRLDPREARVLGVLIEKEMTTPDQYPLTLNAATSGANQKNNRDPVLELADSEVLAALQKLILLGFVGSVHPVGSRVEKFRHNAEAVLKTGKPQLAVLAELLLRGAQQPGEIRGRASRMAPIESLPALADVLKPMLEAGLVVRLDPAPGTRAERYAQTLSPNSIPVDARRAPPSPAVAPMALLAPEAVPEETIEKRVAELEFSVSRLRRQLDNLAWKLGEKLEG